MSLSLYIIHLLIFSLISTYVISNQEEDNLLQGLNSYRTAQSVPPFAKNDKADCVADEIADKLEDEPCTNHTTVSTITPGSVPPRLSTYQDILSECKVDPNSTRDGLILPVCIPNRVPTLVLTNYTHTSYAQYLNDSRYVGAGVGSEKEWMVVVLTTSTPGGSFSSGEATSLRVMVGLGLMGLLFNCLLVLDIKIRGQENLHNKL
ncbi:BnaAnng13320D [Brassica napus]|uniref:BnaAnng13320D protein n=1 Tax=Brassica napus TaxID=3708 RepID=A0A078IU02_BRANA|nr:BnaAnng13320D [Brassica napus]